jgi:hypothetical protein
VSSTTNELRSRNLRTVAALAGLFLLPLLVSFWLYYATDWRPTGSTIHGELISPARPLASKLFADKWTLVYVGDGSCADACRRSLLVMRQTRLALNNEMTRVQRVFLVTSHCCNEEFIRREHPGLVTVEQPEPALLANFPTTDRDDMLFVVDPMGNLMMRYDSRQNPKGLLEDLKKLLKLSHIG